LQATWLAVTLHTFTLFWRQLKVVEKLIGMTGRPPPPYDLIWTAST
jgi:hypothetical protein